MRMTFWNFMTILMIAGGMTACAVATPSAEVTRTPNATKAATVTTAPTPAATPTETGCQQKAGSVERVKVPSKYLASPMWISVYPPPCYSDQPEEAYPVLYLLHGQNMDDNYWQTLGAPKIADEAILGGERPFLIVMPYEESNFEPVADSGFDDALIEELIPWVDEQYPTCTARECRAIGGISRGGGWAVHAAVLNFDMFGAVGAHSAGIMGDSWRIALLLTTHTKDEFPRYYVDRGEDDFLAEYIDQFEKALTSGGIAHEYEIRPGKHDGSYWQAHVKEYMQWYMAGW